MSRRTACKIGGNGEEGQVCLMAQTHCMGPGQGPGNGTGTIENNGSLSLCNVCGT